MLPRTPMTTRLLALLVVVALFAGCGDDSSSDPEQTAQSFPANPRVVFGGDRPTTLQVPSTYNVDHPLPLLVVLHGYGADGLFQSLYLKVPPLVESEGILLVAPDGTIDNSGSRFWNATPACCNFNRSTVDDVAYIRGLIDDIRHDYNVDRRRIYLFGHSNGAFMAHRLACDAASEVAAIVSLAGATFDDAAACKPAEPVSVLDIHGDADTTIRFAGGTVGAPYPSELKTMTHWQVYDRCTAGLVSDPTTLNLDFLVSGSETTIRRFDGCASGTGVELWTIRHGGHVPNLTHDFPMLVWQWLSDHPKS
jgi:polyhydroxybutyrate depolymerase